MNKQIVHLEEIDGRSTQLNIDSITDVRKYMKSTTANEGLLNNVVNEHIQVEQLFLREYQKELCVDAIAGHNAIICAPTGSGKTVVAVHVIRDHLRKMIKQKKVPRVVLLVPTVNLIDQQEKVLKKYLANEFRIGTVKGGQTSSSKMPKALMLRQLHVGVMTPQIFVNMLTFINDDDDAVLPNSVDVITQLGIGLDEISMIVMDECHHCDKSHAYNEVMALYFDCKNQSKAPGAAPFVLPQIVGLTASLGVGQADTPAQAIDHVIKICANMATTKICTIELNSAELENFVYAPKDKIESVRCSHSNHALSTTIILIMKVLENNLKPIFDLLEKSGVKQTKEVSTTPPETRWSANYTSWIHQWYHYAPKIHDSERKRNFITLIEHCIVYHKALEINALVPTSFAVQYMNEEFTEKQRKATVPLDVDLLKLYFTQKQKFDLIVSTDQPKPIVEKLEEILVEEYKIKEDSRTLIFVRTRALAVAVKKFINSNQKLKFLNANHLTGVNSTESNGQTLREQEDCLEKFRQGIHKVIVATTVAEEGLDIDKCNLVIKYNHVTNEIALVQRRGRGRAFGSKSILLTHEGWIQQKEMVNLLRERLMKTAIETIKTKSEAWLVDQVEKRIDLKQKDREIEKSKREVERRKLGNKVFNLLCKKCDALLTKSIDVRSIESSHFVSIDPQIWERVRAEPKSSMQLYSSVSVTGNMMCTKCCQDAGTVIKYSQVYLPTIKADSVVIVDPNNGNKYTSKKWKQIQEKYFVVDPVKRQELLPMHRALCQQMRVRMDLALAQEQEK